MLKLFNRKKKDNKGFTLVELVVVIAILAILVGLLAPQYTKYVEKSRKSADATNVENVVTAIKVAASDGEYDLPAGEYTVELTKTGMTVKSNAIFLWFTRIMIAELYKMCYNERKRMICSEILRYRSGNL